MYDAPAKIKATKLAAIAYLKNTLLALFSAFILASATVYVILVELLVRTKQKHYVSGKAMEAHNRSLSSLKGHSDSVLHGVA